MRLITIAPLALAVAAFGAGYIRPAVADPALKVSGPHVHENLAVYFIHGPSAAGPVPLTLAEALAKGAVRVIETGHVNALEVENLGTEDVFIQSGDIVKGGKQDRVLTVSLLLPQRSGKVAIDSFCVEQGRWTARGREDVKMFASSTDALPSREAKLAMKIPPKVSGVAPAVATVEPPAGNGRTRIATGNVEIARGGGDDTASKQRKVWDEVAKIQQGLSARLGATVAASSSATSLQLSLENDKLKEARATYIKALEGKTADAGDIVGFVFALNGRVNSADVYPSHALFVKMWPKLLASSVTEAIGGRVRANEPAAAAAPSNGDIDQFLKAAEGGKVHEAAIAKLMRTETRDADKSLYVEARRADGAWVHRNYLAK